jgi:hypothetical protein
MSIFKDGSNRRGDHLLSRKKAVGSPSSRIKVSDRPVVGGRSKAKADTSKLSVIQTVNMLIDQINDDVNADEKKAAETSSSGFFGDRVLSLIFTGTMVTSIMGLFGFYVVPEKVVGKFGEEYEIFGHGIETAGYSLSYPSVADGNDISGGIVKVVTNDIARESQDVIVNTGGDMRFQSFTFPTTLISDTYRDLKKESMVYDHQSLEAASFVVPKANIVYRSFVAKRDMDYREVFTALTTNDPVASNIAVSTINGLIIFNSYGEKSGFPPRTREPKTLGDLANEWKAEMESSSSPFAVFTSLTYGPAAIAKAFGWTGDGPNFFMESRRLNRSAVLKEGQRVVISADSESVTFFFPHFK